MPFFSIITPVYNNEKYLPRAVQSVQSQNFTDWEMIIIDDGSTDKTGIIADELASNDRRIRVIHQKNQWIYASFNNGIKEALGKYIFIVNSDDFIEEKTLETAYEVLSKKNFLERIIYLILRLLKKLNLLHTYLIAFITIAFIRIIMK